MLRACFWGTVALLPWVVSGQTPDAQAILEQVSARYGAIESGRFEWVKISQTKSQYGTSKNEIRYEVSIARPDRIKVLIDYGDSRWVRVSDGKELIRYRSGGGDADREPFSGDVAPILNSTRIGTYQNLSQNLKSAKVVGTESVPAGGKQVECHVIEAVYEPRLMPEGSEPLPNRFWIDKERLLVVREVWGSKSGKGSNAMENTNVADFKVAETGEVLPESAFAFVKR